jgi:CDP-diacylglycerol--serine O-phosphatidyltransferase
MIAQVTRGRRGREPRSAEHAQLVFPQPKHTGLRRSRGASHAAHETGVAGLNDASSKTPSTLPGKTTPLGLSGVDGTLFLPPGAGLREPGSALPGAPSGAVPPGAPSGAVLPGAPSGAVSPGAPSGAWPGWPTLGDPGARRRVAEPDHDDAWSTPTTIPLLPGERTPARRLKFALANGCTVASLLMGMMAVFLAIGGEFRFAALALLSCVIFDGCDGGLARRFGVASPFGAQMDSMADLGSFGVAAGIVTYEWLVAHGVHATLAAPACGLVAVCAAIRLARFNVSPKDGRYFCGVPTTMLAAVLALDILIGPHLPAGAQVLAIVVYALAMVSSFPYAKLVKVLRLPLWVWVLPAICAMISLPGTFAVIAGIYLVSGPLLWLYRSRARRPLIPAA